MRREIRDPGCSVGNVHGTLEKVRGRENVKEPEIKKIKKSFQLIGSMLR